MVIKAPHQTKVRPATEPYEIHRERQRRQQADLKVYLRLGPVRHVSCYLMPTVLNPPSTIGFHNRLNERKYYKKVEVHGTYVMPICPFCNKKEKRCKCMEDL
jgi:hypothetical protein